MHKKSEYSHYVEDVDIKQKSLELSKQFVQKETQYQLGHLPTEQPHPYTHYFSMTVQENIPKGIELLLKVDGDLPPVARRIFLSPEYEKLVRAFDKAVAGKQRICFSGCGSTGRLAMMLEEMWRQFWEVKAEVSPGDAARPGNKENYYLQKAEQAASIMTGGDRALIRSVENFEDYTSSGKRQLSDLELKKDDILIAISEGGETSSVIGTVLEGLAKECDVFFIFNNPSSILVSHVERSRNVIEDPKVTVLDLYTGAMALTGSTRMQATTMEMLIIGSAMEESFSRYDGMEGSIQSRLNKADMFAALIRDLGKDDNLKIFEDIILKEKMVYDRGGQVKYLASNFLLDIFSDITERSPTFMLPPFKAADDSQSPDSWAVAIDPTRSSSRAWFDMLRRAPRGINWNSKDYEKIAPGSQLVLDPPDLGNDEIARYKIGKESIQDLNTKDSSWKLAVLVAENQKDSVFSDKILRIGTTEPTISAEKKEYCLSLVLESSPINLWKHLAVKLVMNIISTSTMGVMGRIQNNWMIQLDPTNKKLVDRGSRIVSQLAKIDYAQACYELYRSIQAREKLRETGGYSSVSPVIDALNRIL